MSTAYCIQESFQYRHGSDPIPRDVSSANRYGKIIFLLTHTEKPSLHPGPTINKLKTILKDFTDADYIFQAGGDPLGLALTLCALKDLGFRKVNYLRWERETGIGEKRTGNGFYVPVALKLE
jgi:hypothetical protein